jgi:tetratricopeptide (TPR) repeat protein
MSNQDFEIEHGYKSSDYFCNKAQCLAVAGKYEEALVWFDKALAINLYHLDAWRYKGITLKYLGQYIEALDCLQKARSIARHDPDIGYQIASVRGLLGLPRYENIRFQAFPAAEQSKRTNYLRKKNSSRQTYVFAIFESITIAISFLTLKMIVPHWRSLRKRG